MLQSYVEDVRQLHRDVRALISDLDFVQGGGTVRYLLDSSEVSAYVLPDEAQPVALVADESPVARAISYELTTWILFGRRDATAHLLGTTLLLPPPYVAEIESLAHTLRIRSLKHMKELREGREAIHKEAEEFLASAEFREYKALILGERVDTDSLALITNFASSRASRLLRLARLDDPTERLGDILQSNRVAQLRVQYPDINMHEATANRWYDALSEPHESDHTRRDFSEPETRESPRDRKDRSRKRARRFDSVVMGFVYGANSLDPKRLRFRLISRSGAMQEVMTGRGADLSYWKDVGGSPLRHPRSIMAWIIAIAIAGSTVAALGRLRRLAASLEVFLLSAEHSGDQTRGGDIRERFSKIQQEWRSTAELAFSITEAEVTNRASNDAIEKLRKVFHLSADTTALGKHITDWITRIATGVTRSFLLLGYIMQGTPQKQKEVADALSLREGNDGAIVLSSTLTSMPYSIEFYGEKMREYWHGYRHIESPGVFSEFLERWLLEAEGKQDEPILAIAYLTASNQNWEAAEKYAELALSGLQPGERAHEILSILALCKRKHDRTLKGLLKALTLIEQATLDKSKRVPGGYRDPRFLKERAVIIFQLYGADGTEDSAERPPVEEAIGLSNEVLNHPDADDYLKVQVYNNLCYHLLYQTGELHVIQLRDWLDQLSVHQTNLQQDQRKWSPNIRDTIAWARWRMGGNDGESLSLADLKQLTQDYREILEATPSDSADRPDFIKRLATIESAINRRVSAADDGAME